MKKLLSLSLFVVASSAASSASAIDLQGSDTLETFTETLIAQCNTNPMDTYAGGGSTTGEIAMQTGAQQVAPMSRFLRGNRTCVPNAAAQAIGASPAQAEGAIVALDGLAIVASDDQVDDCSGDQAPGEMAGAQTTAGGMAHDGAFPVLNLNGVGGIQCGSGPAGSACVGGQYNISDWTDIPRIIFSGMLNNAGDDIANQDCNSDVRHTLASDWDLIMQLGCANDECDQLQHAFRRSDLSGTTDTFLSLLDLPGVGDEPFCNGTCFNQGAPFCEDNDPIRRACTPDDDVCSDDGTLGLVVGQFVPEQLTPAQAYPATSCANGAFEFNVAALSGQCPDGTASLFGLCLVPVDGMGNANCLNTIPGNLSIFALALSPRPDYRVYNLETRLPGGALVLDAFNQQQTSSWYRIRTSSGCTENSATRNIGCSVSVGDACSIGFSGREAFTAIAGAEPVSLDGVRNLESTVQNLVLGGTTFPLARNLYINTMVGFENVLNGNIPGSDEEALVDCLMGPSADQMAIDAATAAAGFVSLPGGMPRCQDFREDLECGAAMNNDTCF